MLKKNCARGEQLKFLHRRRTADGLGGNIGIAQKLVGQILDGGGDKKPRCGAPSCAIPRRVVLAAMGHRSRTWKIK
jgi:hypothetical protein